MATLQGPQAVDLLLGGVTGLTTEGRGEAAPMRSPGVSAVQRERTPVEKWLQWGVLGLPDAVTPWAFDSWDVVVTRHTKLTREAGALAPLSIALIDKERVLAWRRDCAAIALVKPKADAVTEMTGSRILGAIAPLRRAARRRAAGRRSPGHSTDREGNRASHREDGGRCCPRRKLNGRPPCQRHRPLPGRARPPPSEHAELVRRPERDYEGRMVSGW